MWDNFCFGGMTVLVVYAFFAMLYIGGKALARQDRNR